MKPALKPVYRLFVLALLSSPAVAETIVITTAKDNTLYERFAGDRSNGQGAHIFAGRTGMDGSFLTRRGLIAFDLGAIPAGSVINQVDLQLTLSQSPFGAGTADISLHTLTQDWGEGASNAGEPGGGGAVSAPGDATWLHTFYDGSFWTAEGGDFEPMASASTTVDTPADYLWTSAQMAADVQAWIDNPASNFGWLVLGQEINNRSARRFDSREHMDAAARPALTIDFTAGTPPPAIPVPALGYAGLLFLLGLLAVATFLARRNWSRDER